MLDALPYDGSSTCCTTVSYNQIRQSYKKGVSIE